MQQPPPNIPQAIQVWLAEFDALRREIETRTTFQQAIIGFNLVSTSTILSLAFSQEKYVVLGILLAILSPLLGFYWIDHHCVIMELGAYIRDKIQPALASLVSTQGIFGWESYFAKKRTGRLGGRFSMFVTALFFVPAAVGLGLSASLLDNSFISAVSWSIALLFSVLWLVDWVTVMSGKRG